ncbi:MAG: response regulator [Anaerolineae bacterium]|nr:response regulator [Anaerolineae bacterium]
MDDIPETREQLRKILAFEADIEVVGAASTGREGVDLARELKPDIVLMDINMPDMNGIQATELINREVPTAAVIMMSVQSESDYLRKAMLAGARDFLTKPPQVDELYTTIRKVHESNAEIRRRYEMMDMTPAGPSGPGAHVRVAEGSRAGKVVVVYSPQGGVGVTTIATNVAAALMREGVKVLLVDCNLQFGDVGVFLNLQTNHHVADLTSTVDDLDDEVIDTFLTAHDSGLRVLLAPPRPEIAETIVPENVSRLVKALAEKFDFTVVDTSTSMDDLTIGLLDIADKIILVATPTLPAIKNVRLVLDVLDALEFPPEKAVFVLNRMQSERERGRISAEAIENNLKRQVAIQIPVDDRAMIAAVNRGAPLVAGDRSRSPTRELVELATRLHIDLIGKRKKWRKRSRCGPHGWAACLGTAEYRTRRIAERV